MRLTRRTIMAVLMAITPFSVMSDSGQALEKTEGTEATENGLAGEQMPTTQGRGMPMMGNRAGHVPMGQGQGMPMMQGGGMPMMGGNMGHMPMMQMMQQRHVMMQAHMQRMETHMANIEALLEQLVELQKK